jgi:hypothetical protein
MFYLSPLSKDSHCMQTTSSSLLLEVLIALLREKMEHTLLCLHRVCNTTHRFQWVVVCASVYEM